MRYKCEICDSVFDYPFVREYDDRTDPDGFWEHFKEVLCPICCEPYIEECEE